MATPIQEQYEEYNTYDSKDALGFLNKSSMSSQKQLKQYDSQEHSLVMRNSNSNPHGFEEERKQTTTLQSDEDFDNFFQHNTNINPSNLQNKAINSQTTMKANTVKHNSQLGFNCLSIATPNDELGFGSAVSYLSLGQ